MQADQFAEFVAAIVQSLPRDMDSTTAQGWISNRKALAKVLQQALVPSPEMQSFLNHTGTIQVQPVTRFVARDFFKVNTKKNASVKISYVWENFTTWFLDKVEELPSTNDTGLSDCPYRTSGENGKEGVTLRYQTLTRSSVDGQIIAALGGDIKAETTLAQIADCLKQQANGKNGALFTNGYANIFYVRDVSGVLRTVHVRWDGVGWSVNADSVEHPDEWSAGYQVFSCDS